MNEIPFNSGEGLFCEDTILYVTNEKPKNLNPRKYQTNFRKTQIPWSRALIMRVYWRSSVNADFT